MKKIIYNAFIVTMNPEMDVHSNGAIVIDSNKILEIGKTTDILKKYPLAEQLDATNMLIIPGFVATHVHLFQSLFRGIGTDRPLAVWLDECIWPLSEHLDFATCKAGGFLATAELIRSGITTFVDSHYINKNKDCIDGLAESIEKIGIRGSLCRSCVDSQKLAPVFRETPDEAAKEAERVIKQYHGTANGRIKVRVESLNEQLASGELIRAMFRVSQQYKIGMSMHIAETKTRAAYIWEKYRYSPLEYLNSLGVLGPHLLLAHCVWLKEQDIDLLSETDTRVAYNSVSNQYLADGVAPIPEMLLRGIKVGLGPDGAASNNNLDMFGVMKSAILMQRANRLEITSLNAEKALKMATIDGAKAISMEDEIGSLEAGKKADLVMINLNHIEMTPRIANVSNLVYAATPSAIDSVMIDGTWVLMHGNFTSICEEKVVTDANNAITKIIQAADIAPTMYRGAWNYIL